MSVGVRMGEMCEIGMGEGRVGDCLRVGKENYGCSQQFHRGER